MALQFNPPDWLIKEYMDRKSPAEEANAATQNAIQTYIQMRQQQQAQQSGATQNLLGLLSQDPELIKTPLGQRLMKQSGTDLSGYQPPSLSTGSVNSASVQPPADQPQNVVQPPSLDVMAHDPSGMPISQPEQIGPLVSRISPVINHWNATMGQQTQPQGIQPPAGSPTTPSFEQIQALQGRGKLGKAALDEYQRTVGIQKTGLEMQKLQNELNPNPEAVMTKEQALAAGTIPKHTRILEPSNAFDVGQKEEQFYQKEWDKIVKDTNPLTASSRSTLGMASKANFQADRALTTLSKPVVTNQEAGNVMADIAAIYQTGSPTQFGMSHQEYSTLYGKVQSALQTLTGKPEDALPDAIKQRLIGVLSDMKGTNNAVLKQQLDLTEKSKAKIIKRFPDEWKDIRSTLETNPTQVPPAQTGASANIPTISNDADFKALPSGATFKDPSGQVHRKK